MKKFALGLLVAACALQSMAYAGDDPIKSTVRNRAIRKAKRQRALNARDIRDSKQRIADERQEAIVRRQVMANEAHAAQVQHAINGANSNALQAQSNQIQAQRNAVLAEGNRAIQRAAGIPVCSNCGSTGHYACGATRKTADVLEHEAMLSRLVP